ncbi:MAG TPA: hypothetical protein VGG06_34515 [Thermoanaerobaculia bacterium]
MAKVRRKKRPVAVEQPNAAKQPRAQPVPDFMQLRPAWRLTLMDLVVPFGWHEIDGKTLLYVRKSFAISRA